MTVQKIPRPKQLAWLTLTHQDNVCTSQSPQTVAQGPKIAVLESYVMAVIR